MAVLRRLVLRDFRNFARADLDVPAAGAVVIGDNGQGKTNLLESIYYLQLLRSMRGARDTDLIRFDAPAFHVSAEVTTAHASNLDVGFARRGRKKVVVDGGEVKRLSDALGSLPAVVLSPRDVELITGAPAERRRFLDVTLALTSPRYLSALQSYRAALVRRNAALRNVARGAAEDAVEVWEPALAASGAILLAERISWMERNSGEFERLSGAIGESEPATIRYVSNISSLADARAELADNLRKKRPLDLKRGLTHAGPHRDDLMLTSGGRELRVFGSAGQGRTAAIALRLLEALSIRDARGEEPVLLLDDPFAELDSRRSKRILELLHASERQTILAVPRGGDVPADFRSLDRWRVAEGIITAAA